jgi:hypothetical protein
MLEAEVFVFLAVILKPFSERLKNPVELHDALRFEAKIAMNFHGVFRPPEATST